MPRFRCSATDRALIQLYELYRAEICLPSTPETTVWPHTTSSSSVTYDGVINTRSYFHSLEAIIACPQGKGLGWLYNTCCSTFDYSAQHQPRVITITCSQYMNMSTSACTSPKDAFCRRKVDRQPRVNIINKLAVVHEYIHEYIHAQIYLCKEWWELWLYSLVQLS